MARDGKVRIKVFGAGGRMGRAIAAAAAAREDVAVVDGDADVFLDFSAPDALEANLDAAAAAGKPILVGTTGLGEAQLRLIDEAGGRIGVIHAPNTSLGVNLLRHLVEEAAARLGPEWDVEIVEMHHRDKKDAPSGTALLLGASAAKGRGAALPELARFDRMAGGAREAGTIGFASLRGGSVAGEHQVIFAADGERLELGHRADSRMIFARGALAAALWLAGRPAGRYTMADVLGLA
ncbi:MAG: 4-hydroxy-tetrahydrodipicolinate reductase [Alphaproteobacteria bacterium]|nr:4-hydroxy-tetrahydrodipicolinate reductase [Alphaproteobacteria bacterium]MBV9371467.1 4-hydroxy-tetrahydrodipicolinate reductase [Alphaproteobacteria bacterium]MBV9902404.1 4-hydroxy-tetrahydrodipicolinate reductase [Alphaproteobacteria bacterium]